MSKILITGATGFIGRSLVPALVAAGHDIRCAVWQKVDGLNAEQIVINKLEEKIDWSAALDGVDIVIHLAARVHIMKENAQSSLQEYCKVNSIATKNFAEQAARHHVKRFIFLSSIKVNGEFTPPLLPFSEQSDVQPEDPYAKSKLYAEQYLQEISQRTGMETVILRPPLVYGPGVKANFLKMLHMIKKGWPLPFGKVANKRSFIYIDNLISAIVAVMDHPNAANQLFLVADNDAWSLTELLTILSQGMNVQLKLLNIPVAFLIFFFKLIGFNNLNLRLFRSLEVSNNKIKSQLGWMPPVTSQEGLKITAAWYQYDHNSK
ncbi:NAD-dependent epimerase/dehydratase family protein [Legionella worsleiensis]|uniref:NAD dependent epimerase/dehydratase n=1 Tax=Legionella worsleiensis TaxID=45076 RepID=A0A0W1A3C0_9GAMM|nr:NAD-dependent epimerase/dehydratase family protein [Legionella worsleiensis]KTD75863.1 NAD dependent epimerase/dehydratase [Legionella worsleiensis]STY32876.1 NAD dependent epimerase/dehydratase, UDP-glucose-4-epimerase [Legionella worsleiensis]